MPNLLALGDISAAFLCRRRRVLPVDDRGFPSLAVARRAHDQLAARPGRPLVRLLLVRFRRAAPGAGGERENAGGKALLRYDKNKDGKVQPDEYLAARRKNFDKLDLDHNGALSFQEYAAKAIEKFNGAGGRKGWLTETEFATTAPPRAKRRSNVCSCRARAPQAEPETESQSSDTSNDN